VQGKVEVRAALPEQVSEAYEAITRAQRARVMIASPAGVSV
jgi:hypothetical protein